MTELTLSIFSVGGTGGNPCTISQKRRSTDEMLELARTKGHECCLIERDEASGFRLRFFAPAGEMPTCAHASAAAAWLLCTPGKTPTNLHTKSGTIRAHKIHAREVSISQPTGRTQSCDPAAALVALGLTRDSLALDGSIVNAATTRLKTLVPIASVERLQELAPNAEDVRVACDVLGSTGLYPWALVDEGQVEARQFPRSAGYLEDPATGVAAAALFFALGAPKRGLTVHQGRAMGRLSRMQVSADPAGHGCFLTGSVRILDETECAAISPTVAR